MKVAGVMNAIRTTLSGMSTQMKKLEIISENIANADRIADKDGKVYQRKVMTYQSEKNRPQRRFAEDLSLQLRRNNNSHLHSDPGIGRPQEKDSQSFKVVQQNGEEMIFNPDHPMADENGYVKMPKVDLVEEMVDLVSASRTYEANVTVMNAAKQMARKSMEI